MPGINRSARDVGDVAGPFLTGESAPVPGRIKVHPTDFVVEELPLYEPCGSGDHCFFSIRKQGIDTWQAIRLIAGALRVSWGVVGHAGLKDAAAVTTQVLSIEHVEPERVEALRIPGVEVLWAKRHTNKLRMGHLRGNRFRIRLREVDTARAADVQAVLERLMRGGAPNYFGPQRFGIGGRTWRVGRALIRGDWGEATAVLAGRPQEVDTGRVRRAREHFDAGQYAEAAQAWPGSFPSERRVCESLSRAPEEAERALRRVERRMREFYLSAYQAYLFNQIVAARIDALGQVWDGDLACLHHNNACFLVTDAAAEQPRCDAFEISPSGPMFGSRMSAPAGRAGEMEAELLAREGLTPRQFAENPLVSAKGGRRALRFRPGDAGCEAGRDEHGDFIELRFELPSGCYATAVLREVVKRDLAV